VRRHAPSAVTLLGTPRFEKVRLTGYGPRFNKIGKAIRHRLADLDAFYGTGLPGEHFDFADGGDIAGCA
jgi:hypothetical protein